VGREGGKGMHGRGYSVTTCLHRQVTTCLHRQVTTAGSPGWRWAEDLMGGTGETRRLMTKVRWGQENDQKQGLIWVGLIWEPIGGSRR
jgi:hypothetical protein